MPQLIKEVVAASSVAKRKHEWSESGRENVCREGFVCEGGQREGDKYQISEEASFHRIEASREKM